MLNEREYQRARLSSKVILRDGVEPEEGLCTNISLGGIYVRTPSHRPEGTEVELEFELPPNRRLRVRGRVIRTAHHSHGKYHAGMAIRFMKLPSEAKKEIEYYVRKTYRILRAIFFELNRADVNEERIWKLVDKSPIEHRYPLDILKEVVASELAGLRLRAGGSLRKR